jgi:hypothetical protein
MKATMAGGKLKDIEEIYIDIDGNTIYAYILPDISDAKSATYADENAIGRTQPYKNYSYSENRVITWTHHWIVDVPSRVEQIRKEIKMLQALVYPSNAGLPYAPPFVAHVKCGNMLDYGQEDYILCCILKSYSLKYATDVPWYNDSSKNISIPYKVDMDLNFEVVYDNNAGKIPYAEDISSTLGDPTLNMIL